MRIVEIHVERLKSYSDYSNRSIRLVARLDEGEDVKEAYLKLAKECETLLELQKIEADKSSIEAQIKSYEQRKKELEKIWNEFLKIREEIEKGLRSLEEELEKIERLAEEKQIKLSEKVLEKLRSIRRALYGYDP
ncbi:MAG: hypothetical protein DRO39_05605 [Thermoprotei archaeon]|nr:MAG: hypothetical protein DRO39_05605 [Thermoprotei archaeon]